MTKLKIPAWLYSVTFVLVLIFFTFGYKGTFKFENTVPGDNVIIYNEQTMSYTGVLLSLFAMKTDIPTNNNQLANGSGFITASSIPAPYTNSQARNSISLTTNNSSGASTYNPSTGVFNIPTYSFPTFTAGTGISISNGVITNTSPNQSVSITGANGINITGSYPSFNVGYTQTLPTYNNSPTRTLNAAGLILSSTKAVRVSYSVTHTIALTLLVLNGASNVYLEISPNNTTWTTISQAGYNDGVAVAVAITKSQTNNVQGEIPAGFYFRLRSVVSGGGSATFANGQEVIIN